MWKRGHAHGSVNVPEPQLPSRIWGSKANSIGKDFHILVRPPKLCFFSGFGKGSEKYHSCHKTESQGIWAKARLEWSGGIVPQQQKTFFPF